ncbi:37116_t:CDS:2, partial [Gigaspora margarita]
PVFEYGNLPNTNKQHYLNDISRRTINILGRNEMENNHLGIHSCKSGYFTHLTCGYLRSNKAIYFDALDPYRISYVINIENHFWDIGGPVFHYSDINNVYLSGILTGGIGNIGLATDINKILIRGGLFLEL